MRKRTLKELPCVALSSEKDTIELDTIKNIMRQYASDCVYFLDEGALWGMVSAGDVLREIHEKIKIKRDFARLKGWQFVDARRVFSEHRNYFMLPVTDDEGKLIGDYYRNDEAAYFAEHYHFLRNSDRAILEATLRKNQSKAVFLVEPLSSRNNGFYHTLAKCLDEVGIGYQGIAYATIPAHFDESPCFVFATVEEFRCVQALLQNELHELDVYHMTIWTYAILVEEFIKRNKAVEETRRYYDAAFDKKDDLTVVLMNNDNLAVYCSNLFEIKPYIKKIQAKDWEFLDIKLYDGNARRIFCELYSEKYWKAIGENAQRQIDLYRFHATANLANRLKKVPEAFRKIILSQNRENMAIHLEDVDSPYMHVTNGIRRTMNQPEEYERTIYFLGNCLTVGVLVEDGNTLESILQKKLNEEGIKCRVVNYSSFGDEGADMMWNRILELDLKKGDILILYKYAYHDERFLSLNLPEIAAEARMPSAWTTDSLAHCNHKAYKVYADKIYELLQDKLRTPPDSRGACRMDWRPYCLRIFYFERFFASFNPSLYENIGCIVISADPFTKGQRYIIERALEETECLIVFVQGEKSQLLPIAERLAAARECLKDLKNVFVVRTTMARYALDIDEERDFVESCFDQRAAWFAEFIAKPLGIKKRFFGEEPEDEVERAYNMALKRILPRYGMTAIELHRLELEMDGYISAGKARDYIRQGQQEKAFDFMPEAMRKFF